MKLISFITIFLISAMTFGQISSNYHYDSLTRTGTSYYENGQIYSKHIQLDTLINKHTHDIYYHKNGQKSGEWFEKNQIIYDTLKEWSEDGQLSSVSIYTDSGYTETKYWWNKHKCIREIGQYKIAIPPFDNDTVYDSSTFDVYISVNCNNYIKPCFIRTGIWKSYYISGVLANEGQYLPMPFEFYVHIRDSSGYAVPIKKTSFPTQPECGLFAETYLKDGVWIYYDEKGIKTKEEFYKDGLLLK